VGTSWNYLYITDLRKAAASSEFLLPRKAKDVKKFSLLEYPRQRPYGWLSQMNCTPNHDPNYRWLLWPSWGLLDDRVQPIQHQAENQSH
jgi:hypothetical protein